jgi:hypothetical protein
LELGDNKQFHPALTNKSKPFSPLDSTYELSLRSSADPQFGPVLLVGQGGKVHNLVIEQSLSAGSARDSGFHEVARQLG